MRLFSNDVTGTIPTQVGQMSKMNTGFQLDTNKLSSSIPSELGRVTGLREVWLQVNSFTGSLPTEVGKLLELTSRFNLHTNEVSGSIPTQLGNMVKLSYGVELDRNEFLSSIENRFGPIRNNQIFNMRTPNVQFFKDSYWL